MGLYINSLDFEIPYWIAAIFILGPLMIVAMVGVGPNCHGLCTEEQAVYLKLGLYVAVIGGAILLTIGISIWQVVMFILASRGKPVKPTTFDLSNPSVAMSFGGIAFSTGGVTILLVFLSLSLTYGFNLAYIPAMIIPAIFFTAGFFFMRFRMKKVRMKILLRQRGKAITTDFLSVEMDMLYSVNARHPYQITSLGVHPRTHRKIRFFSDYIWLNPEGHVPEKIKVIVDPEDDSNYHMDLSFLKQKLKDINWDDMITERFRIKERP